MQRMPAVDPLIDPEVLMMKSDWPELALRVKPELLAEQLTSSIAMT